MAGKVPWLSGLELIDSSFPPSCDFTLQERVKFPVFGGEPIQYEEATGTIKWIGKLPRESHYKAAILLDGNFLYLASSDGIFEGRKFVTCEPGRTCIRFVDLKICTSIDVDVAGNIYQKAHTFTSKMGSVNTKPFVPADAANNSSNIPLDPLHNIEDFSKIFFNQCRLFAMVPRSRRKTITAFCHAAAEVRSLCRKNSVQLHVECTAPENTQKLMSELRKIGIPSAIEQTLCVRIVNLPADFPLDQYLSFYNANDQRPPRFIFGARTDELGIVMGSYRDALNLAFKVNYAFENLRLDPFTPRPRIPLYQDSFATSLLPEHAA